MQKSKNLYKICNVRKWSKINFREKIQLTDPYYFASFGGMASIKFFSKTKNGPVMNKKNLFLAITFEPLNQKFLKSGL